MANDGATVEIPLSTDHFECAVLLEAVKAEGHEAQLLTEMPDSGSNSFGSPSRLLIFERDLEAVTEILGRSFPIE